MGSFGELASPVVILWLGGFGATFGSGVCRQPHTLHMYLQRTRPLPTSLNTYSSFHDVRAQSIRQQCGFPRKSSTHGIWTNRCVCVETVLILTHDGRTLTGKLMGHDQTTNVILASTVERIFSTPDSEEPSQEVDHGLYLIRGDNVALLGLVDEEADEEIDWTQVKAPPLGPMKRS